MGLQSACCCSSPYPPPTISSSLNQRFFSLHSALPPKKTDNLALLRNQAPGFHSTFKLPLLKTIIKEHSLSSLSRRHVRASSSNQEGRSNFSGQENDSVNGVEPFNGKSGSVSFNGLTHQLVEEGRLVSAPFNENAGSLRWVLAPIALILSLVLPQFFLGYLIDGLVRNEVFAEIVTAFASEIMLYIGLATFLYVTDNIQKPYLQFSPKRWSLITGLKGYLTTAFFTSGFKVIAPLFAVYVTWPVLGFPALVSVAPFLSSCLAQFVFEKFLQSCRSSCWPILPIIFEVYRLYQLSKATYFIEKLMFAMKDVPITTKVLERSGALVAMVVTFQVLGMVCLWSLLAFLQRLFPSRPVAENY